jgi:hypothetical protein
MPQISSKAFQIYAVSCGDWQNYNCVIVIQWMDGWMDGLMEGKINRWRDR